MLPPISTTGLGPDDVSDLANSTRELMLRTLKDISAPGPSSASAPRAIPSEETRSNNLEKKAAEGLRERRQEGSSSGGAQDVRSQEPLELDQTNSRGEETTEDEMDEDAVMLKRPKVA